MTNNSGKSTSGTSFAFTKGGIVAISAGGDRCRIGDAITVAALGTGIQDRAAYTVIKLLDRDNKIREMCVRSSLLTASTSGLVAELTDNHHYRWPAKKYVSSVIDALAAKNPKRRINITMVPGWQGARYVHPHELIKPKGDDWECLFADSPNVHRATFYCNGTLAEWKKEVALHCRLSSRLRLAIGVPFAATIIRRLKDDTFGFHIVGGTSSSKTFCLRAAGSVPGFNSEAGVTSWDGTPTGFEQLALGRRDNVLPLDETGVIEGDEKTSADFVRLSVFRFAKNQTKHRAGEYARGHTVDSDFRNIVMSTGEDVLPIGRRLRGQDVRLIQIPAEASAFDDIFDGEKALKIVGRTTSQREKFVNRREAATRQYQGIAEIEFLRRLVNDSDADSKIKAAIDEFISESPITQSQSGKAFARMCRRFAAVYAASALAIDYDILPFAKKATLRDIRKCMNDAIKLLIDSQAMGSTKPHLSDEDLIGQFRARLVRAKFIKAGAHTRRAKPLAAEQIEAAEGFINYTQSKKYRVMLQICHVRAWYPDEAIRARLVTLLHSRQIFFAGRQADTCSRQVKLKPHPEKLSVYWLSLKALGLTLNDLKVS